MILYINTDTNRLQRSLGFEGPADILDVKWADTPNVDVYFLRQGVPVALEVDATGEFGLKEKYTDASYVVHATTWTKYTDTNGSPYYRFTPSFNTQGLADSLDATNTEFKQFRGEVEWVEGSTRSSTLFFNVRVWNQIIKQTGDDPTDLNIPRLNALLTDADSLEQQDTASGAVSTGRFVAVPDADSNRLQWFELVDGTNATDSPWYIRPHDYDGSTNARVWRLWRLDAFDDIRWLSAITGRTGGTSTKLDSLTTVNMPVGSCVAFVDATLGFIVYQLTAGTTAESDPTTIRPDDYNGTTNQKVWSRAPIYATDTTAIHIDAADEFDTASLKATLHDDDRFLLEDSEDNLNKKYTTKSAIVAGLGAGGGTDGFVFLDAVTGLTGGGTALDGVTTTGITVPYEVAFFNSSAVFHAGLMHYQLVSGTDAEKAPWIVRPDDYNVSTNAKVWRWMPGAVAFSQGLTSLTGSASNDLDWVPTTRLPVGFIVMMQSVIPGTMVAYKLRAGTQTDLQPRYIRPDDYNVATNQKYWELIPFGDKKWFSQEVIGPADAVTVGDHLAMSIPIGMHIHEIRLSNFEFLGGDPITAQIDISDSAGDWSDDFLTSAMDLDYFEGGGSYGIATTFNGPNYQHAGTKLRVSVNSVDTSYGAPKGLTLHIVGYVDSTE